MAISRPTIALVAAIAQAYALVALGPAVLHLSTGWSWTSALLLNLVLNFGLLLAFNLLIWPNYISPLRHLPGPKGGWPLIGRADAMFESPPAKQFTEWQERYKNDGLIRFQGLWNEDVMLITSPQALAEILVAKPYSFQKPSYARDQLRAILGDGLVVVEGDMHKFQRKRLLPPFGFRHIKDLYPVMWSKANDLCVRIAQEMEGKDSFTTDISEWASKAALDAIGVAAFGRDLRCIYNSDESGVDDIANMYRRVTKLTPLRLMWLGACVALGPRIVRMLPFPIKYNLERELDKLHRTCRELVEEKREALKNGQDNYDLLSVLIKYDDFDTDGLVHQLLTFMAAGSDTSAYTFTWGTWSLAVNPDVQAKLREEIWGCYEELVEAHERNDGSLANILEALPYLNGTIMETLRLYPTVPTNQRVAIEDVTVLGQRMPKGSQFVISSLSINRDKKYWGADADEFRPERWIDASTGKPNNHGGAASNYNQMTFLAGPRSCIGQGFAKTELRCMIAAWVARFHVENANKRPPRLIQVVSLKPVDGMHIKITPVTRPGKPLEKLL